jgi:hypothetical protein
MKKHILNTFALNLQYAQGLAKDIPDAKFCEQPGGVLNHPAFVLGHLAMSCDYAGGFLGLSPACPTAWKEVYAMSAKPLADRSKYPRKEELLKALEEGHARIAKAFESVADADLSKPSAPELAKWGFPTNGDMLIFLLTAHEGTHLGQLSMWRRAAGMPPLF